MSSSVAVLDIGSNSIKILVARRGANGGIETVFNRTRDSRISAGIGQARPELSPQGIARGLAAIEELLADAAPFAPEKILLVATSAVRDARNGPEFRALVAQATGHQIRILSGEEEANGIGRGLTADPALADRRNFYVFDLGGGSLECLAFRERRMAQALSLQLGCVRLTEKFVPDPSAAISADALGRIAAHTRGTLAQAGFRFDLPEAMAVGTGGTVTTVRAIRGARGGKKTEATEAFVELEELRQLLDFLAPLPLVERQKVAGLPAARADVFPCALATLVAVAEAGGFPGFHHSFSNLRYGLAAELLEF